ncbi:glutathione S-transferase family protein [Leptospira mtsangambouensis]|nr:glutathione S-transferase N-terminal domain-containing protein [Leptospira mtsangambouensis]
MDMIELFEFSLSGNSYKIRLMLSFLNLKYESRIFNPVDKEHKSEKFLELNPFGQVPVLKDGNLILRDSQAILVYLARAYGESHWFPDDPIKSAEIVAWLSTAANEVSRGPSALRVHYLLGRTINLEEAKQVTENLLNLLEKRLSSRNWLAIDELSIADIAMYPYIALCHQGQVDLSEYKNIRKWMHRIEALPNYITMPGIEPQITKSIE